ncbi:isatin hydrolase-like [Stegodyphus dumicola]|uniref:isatin hydrolase-like n=1 Tax=Stegodyphus dumicola TaxID=202533 RepID=UPI0015AB300F|nr:isatin hydrolase-like [Stegodyphus dumicola]
MNAKIYILTICFYCLLNSNAWPIAKRMVDMTYTFDETTLHFPTAKPFELTTNMNGTTPEGFWLQFDEFSSGIHLGTHMDAPCHFSKGGMSVDEIPLSTLIAPAAVIDITERANQNPDEELTIDDLLNWERKTQQNLNGTIVLLRSGWGRRWGNLTAYAGTSENDITKLRYPGFSPEAVQWLIDNRNIPGIGIDTFSFDRGISREFMSHRILLGNGKFALENVANMEELPIYGATLYVMPMKIGKASGAPTRIIATFPEVIFNTEEDWKSKWSTNPHC